jgi:hypothetical protein
MKRKKKKKISEVKKTNVVSADKKLEEKAEVSVKCEPPELKRKSPQNRQRNEPPELTGVFWNAPVPDILQRHR